MLPDSNEMVVSELQLLLDSANVKGAILIYDLEKDQYHSNDFSWCRRGQLPASTFKITNSIIALETGVIEDDSTLIKWDGEDRRMKVWEQDLVFRDAFHFSCVPCYQGIAREIGVDRMNSYLAKLNYGSMVVDSSSIDLFWLVGESKITPFEQIDFLKRFYRSELPISMETEKNMKRLMIIDETEDYTISGKTGWSIRNGNDNGWFVGYLEVPENTYFFATNVEPKASFEMDKFQMIRKNLSYQAFKEMGLID
jgi:beta-lactamase class D